MDETSSYEDLLDEDRIDAAKGQRSSIESAIDDLLARIKLNNERLREFDGEDEQLWLMVWRLDEVYAHLSRYQKYMEEASKLVGRQFWDDNTFKWVE